MVIRRPCPRADPMDHDAVRVRFRRLVRDDDTAWDVLYDGCVVGRIARMTSFGRTYSKSQMCTRYVLVWQSSVAHVAGLSDDDRRRVQRELNRPDKRTRKAEGFT